MENDAEKNHYPNQAVTQPTKPRSNSSSPTPPPSNIQPPTPDFQYPPIRSGVPQQNGQSPLYQRLRQDYSSLIPKADSPSSFRVTPQYDVAQNGGQTGAPYPMQSTIDRNVLRSIQGRGATVEDNASLWKSEQRDSDTGSIITGVSLGTKSALILGPKRPKPHKVWRKRFVKILVVGDSGLGKTTLIRTLLSVPGEDIQLHDGSGTSLQVFEKKPQILCSELYWKDEDDKIQWVYRIQDTPGYGDVLNLNKHIKTICDYVTKQNQQWLDIEMHRRRNKDMQDIEDPKVDICIFCLPPHRVHASDLHYMHELGKVVPIVPVVTKADTMTALEAQQYRQEVYNSIKGAKKIPGVRGAINVFNFDEETLERCHIAQLKGKHNMPPFLVIGSNDVNQEMSERDPPVLWPERNYPWGRSEAFNPDHSDLIYLRLLLLKEGAEEISQETKKRYEEWRQKKLTKLRIGHRFKQIIFGTCTIVGVGAVVLVASSRGNVHNAAKIIESAQKQIGSKMSKKADQKPVDEKTGKAAEKEHNKKKGWF